MLSGTLLCFYGSSYSSSSLDYSGNSGIGLSLTVGFA